MRPARLSPITLSGKQYKRLSSLKTYKMTSPIFCPLYAVFTALQTLHNVNLCRSVTPLALRLRPHFNAIWFRALLLCREVLCSIISSRKNGVIWLCFKGSPTIVDRDVLPKGVQMAKPKGKWARKPL